MFWLGATRTYGLELETREHESVQSNLESQYKRQAKKKRRRKIVTEHFSDQKTRRASRQRPGKGAIRKRFPLQKPRWEKLN